MVPSLTRAVVSSRKVFHEPSQIRIWVVLVPFS
jgi:hypothetical protein